MNYTAEMVHYTKINLNSDGSWMSHSSERQPTGGGGGATLCLFSKFLENLIKLTKMCMVCRGGHRDIPVN